MYNPAPLTSRNVKITKRHYQTRISGLSGHFFSQMPQKRKEATKRNEKRNSGLRVGNEKNPTFSRNGTREREFSLPCFLVFFAAVCGCASFIVCTKLYQSPGSRFSGQQTAYKTGKQVEVKSWSRRKPFAEMVAKLGEPVVLRDTLVEDWPARRLWNPSYLKTKLTRLENIYVNSNRWFGPYYDVRKPLSHLTKRLNAYQTNVTMRGSDFFRELATGPKKVFIFQWRN
eukprot:m.188927 g.188927  ORF g.188927 m.188927 type:complete len:228 (+) comp39398_c0_seq3:66-749(+)